MLFTKARAITKTAYLACLVLAAATHYYASASTTTLPGDQVSIIGFNSYLTH